MKSIGITVSILLPLAMALAGAGSARAQRAQGPGSANDCVAVHLVLDVQYGFYNTCSQRVCISVALARRPDVPASCNETETNKTGNISGPGWVPGARKGDAYKVFACYVDPAGIYPTDPDTGKWPTYKTDLFTCTVRPY